MRADDDYSELVIARLFDLFDLHVPWHLALWGIGTGLVLDEVVECSGLTRDGAFTSKEGLRYVGASASRLVVRDPGHHPRELRAAILARAAEVPGVEAVACAAGSHLLDSGFSSPFLHDWLRRLVRAHDGPLDISDVLDEAAALCTSAPVQHEVVIPFTAVPGGYRGEMPPGWLDAQATKEWLARVRPTPSGDHRQAGALRLDVLARDPWSAAATAAERAAQVAARVAVSARRGRLRPKGIAWVRGSARPHPLRLRTRVQLRSLQAADRVFDVPTEASGDVVHDAVEIFSALESGTRGAALTGGWAAVEGLLLRPTERPHTLAADRLAAVVACAFPRAALTPLAHRHQPTVVDALARGLAGIEVNVERCRVLESSIRAGRPPVVARASDRAMLRRVEGMVASPGEKLENVRSYVQDTLRRLYTHRNLIMHAGSFQSVTLAATLRTAPNLVAAGIDRILDAQLGPERVDPLALAARAEVELGLLGSPAARRLSDLLS